MTTLTSNLTQYQQQECKQISYTSGIFRTPPPPPNHYTFEKEELTEEDFCKAAKFSSLEKIEINSKKFNESWLQHLSKLEKLQELSFSSPSVTGKIFSYVPPKVTRLFFSNCDSLELANVCCKNVQNVGDLFVENCPKIAAKDLATFACGLSSLQMLRLEKMKLTNDFLLKDLVVHKNLATLSLDSCTGFEAGPLRYFIRAASKLQNLAMRCCSCVTDKVIETIVDVDRLEVLDIRKSSGFSVDAMAALKKSQKLKKVFISKDALQKYQQFQKMQKKKLKELQEIQKKLAVRKDHCLKNIEERYNIKPLNFEPGLSSLQEDQIDSSLSSSFSSLSLSSSLSSSSSDSVTESEPDSPTDFPS